VIHECLHPLKLTTAARLALCRTELVGLLFTQHGFHDGFVHCLHWGDSKPSLSHREHLTKTAGKWKNRNNLLMKLAGSTWGASANTLRSSALALCYSAAEYCAPVWSRSAHTSQVDVQLNSTMRLISGTLHSTLLP